ncbi:MAG: M1 family metallopeptidase [Longimicrobiales bacterium]
MKLWTLIRATTDARTLVASLTPVVAAALILATATPTGAQGHGDRQQPERYHPFQQAVAYRIEASQDDTTDVLTGRARLRYTNHAPEAVHRLYFHQYLNAFRPNSAWAEYDLRFDNRTFQDLGPDEHAFERITSFTVDGDAVEPVYPGSPDSTVFYVQLPEPLAPGESLEAMVDWTARLATEPRRQGRADRHYNWAHWYPRIAFYGADGWETRPHIRPGELNGTFAAYDVTLEVPADQVMGATGVPAYGDPGWEAAMVEESEPTRYRRDHFGGHLADGLGLLESMPSPDRKQVRWRAKHVHNFAWSTSPEYRYLGGRWEGQPIHLLWQPSSERWDAAAIMERQKDALDWIVELFGEYPWPQITVTDRVEGGATEYPMLYMTSGGAVVHESMHMVAHGILANNEWKDGWLDEGMASFLTSWLRVEEGADPEQVWGRSRDYIAGMDRAGESEPVGLPGAGFSSYRMYSTMTYTKGSLVLRMLRDMLGEDVFRTGLREYYQRFRFHNVTRHDFRQVMEDVSGRDLGWFFRQWLDTTDWLDYQVGQVSVSGAPADLTVTVEIRREGPAWMPVVVEAGDARTTVESRERSTTVTLHPTTRPEAVVVDPDGSLLDADRSNNRRPVR